MVVFTEHALLKLNQRKIKKEFVLKTLETPDHTAMSPSGRIVAFKKFSKLYPKVIYKRERHNIIVVTQHWVEKM